jgi:hypothetical protein
MCGEEVLEAWIRKRAKLLRWSFFAIFVVTLVCGAIRFPDAPFKKCQTPYGFFYCGKYGAPHTDAEYLAFSAWETTFKIVGGAAFISFFVLSLWISGPWRNDDSSDNP